MVATNPAATANEPLDHPSYLARQAMKFVSTAGNGTISDAMYSPFNMRIRSAAVLVRTAGTSTGYGIAVMAGTATLGSVILSTNTATSSVLYIADMNTNVAPGTYIALKNLGTDATGVAEVTVEWYHDPVNSTWTLGN